jgi:hypothetical protein
MQACPLCNLDALSASGSCMPGVYSLTYSVTNDDGLSATATRQLYVYQAVAVTVALELYSGFTSYAQALQLVASLSNSTLPGYTTGVVDVIAKLGSLADQVEPGDVDITAAAANPQLALGSYSVHVNASVYLYSPRGVHRQDILEVEKPRAVSTQETGSYAESPQRHLLWKESVSADHGTDRHWQTVSAVMLHGSASSGLSIPAAAVAPADSSSSQRRMAALHGTTSSGVAGASVHRNAHAGAAETSAVTNQRRTAADAMQNLQESIHLLEQVLSAADCGDALADGTVMCDAPTAGSEMWRDVAHGQSRRLLQSSGDESLADVLAALGAELGANFTTQGLTEQGVDLLTVSY